jgi:lysophospholipase L1-like esterase
MAKSFSRTQFGAVTGLALSIALAGIAQTTGPARAASAETLEAACRPAEFTAPVANLPRLAAKMRAKAPVKILAIGSSSTEGIGATSPLNAYPARLMTLLNSLNTAVNVDIRNAGIGGETIDQTLARLVNELDTYKPDLVLWQVGTNDAITGSSDPRVFQRLIDKGIKSILARKVDAMLIDPQYFPKIPDTALYQHYIDLVHAAADNNNIVVFPRYQLMVDWNKDLPGGIVPMLGPDHFHMGDRGYACLANLIANEITTSVSHTDSGAVMASPAVKTSTGGAIVPTKIGVVTSDKPMSATSVKLVQPAN